MAALHCKQVQTWLSAVCQIRCTVVRAETSLDDAAVKVTADAVLPLLGGERENAGLPLNETIDQASGIRGSVNYYGHW